MRGHAVVGEQGVQERAQKAVVAPTHRPVSVDPPRHHRQPGLHATTLGLLQRYVLDRGTAKWARGHKQLQYDETFKKNIVALHQNGKTQTELSKEYGISVSAISRWIKLYSEVRVDDNTVMTAKQIKELQKRNAQLEEENIILKKALAIMTPRSGKE